MYQDFVKFTKISYIICKIFIGSGDPSLENSGLFSIPCNVYGTAIFSRIVYFC
jgi:hypothetical protein